MPLYRDGLQMFAKYSAKYNPDVVRTLSTPSLGITEPDSGIFRLSAAFCSGALSHK